MSCANNVLPVYMWPSPEKIPEGLCLRPVQVDTVHFSPEATETNGFSCVSSSLNRTAVVNPLAFYLCEPNQHLTTIKFYLKSPVSCLHSVILEPIAEMSCTKQRMTINII